MTTARTIRVGPAPALALDVAGTGPLVLFLHGIGGNRTNWRDQLPAFAPDFTAAAWDARGYGASDDYEGPLDFGDFSRDLIRVLDHFAAERAHLVGLSMGGFIAQDFYARHPRRVASLVLVDTTGGAARDLSPARIEEFLRLRKAPLLAGKNPRDIASAIAATLVSPRCPAERTQRLVDSVAALHKESYLKTLETVTRWPGSLDLAAVRVPTLVVCGEEDRLTPPTQSRLMASAIPGAALALIPEAGHLSNIEQPERFNEIVLGFLQKHAA